MTTPWADGASATAEVAADVNKLREELVLAMTQVCEGKGYEWKDVVIVFAGLILSMPLPVQYGLHDILSKESKKRKKKGKLPWAL
jgi:hypothetical protein